MYRNNKIAVIIPALNEEHSLPPVLEAIPSYVDSVYVTDNGSTDRTFSVISDAERFPRVVPLKEPRKGYGMACLRGIDALEDEQIVVFLDADFSDYPEGMDSLLDPIVDGKCVVMISNRINSMMEPGSMTPLQIFGNRLSVFLIFLFWGYRYRDLGPFRAVTRGALERLKMADPNYGWTVELQIKALQKKMAVCQVDVPYRVRAAGRSKVGGTVCGTILAGYKILATIMLLKLKGLSWDR